jgi:hypothetical protein
MAVRLSALRTGRTLDNVGASTSHNRMDLYISVPLLIVILYYFGCNLFNLLYM